MHISEEERNKLKEARNILKNVLTNIDFDFREYILIDTAIESIEYAITKENLDD